MFGGLKEQLNKGKEELAIRMNDAYVRSESPSKLIEIIANGNKSIMDIKIDDEIYADKEQFEDELVIALNNALDKADMLYQDELKIVMKSNMPNIPGLDGLLD
jgi:DNA-binding protein YbaB